MTAPFLLLFLRVPKKVACGAGLEPDLEQLQVEVLERSQLVEG